MNVNAPFKLVHIQGTVNALQFLPQYFKLRIRKTKFHSGLLLKFSVTRHPMYTARYSMILKSLEMYQ